MPVTEAPVDEDVEFDENGQPKLKPHPDIDAVFKFTKPDGLVALGMRCLSFLFLTISSKSVSERAQNSDLNQSNFNSISLSEHPELPSGQEVQFLIGVKNNGNKDFVIETIDASLRYPTDYTYNIQNFTSYTYNRLVKPSQEITLAYSLVISEMLNERPFGFLVNLLYKDLNGKLFSNAVFNQTVDIIEINDGVNMEILFVYVFLISLVGLFVFAIYHYFIAKRLGGRSKRKVETGTANDQIDYDWIPPAHLSNESSKCASFSRFDFKSERQFAD